MAIRITTSTMAATTLANLQANLSAMTQLQSELSSGSKINKPSDDPAGTASALQLQQQLRSNDQYSRNINDGQAWLSSVDTALQTAVSQLHVASDRAIQSNSATNSSDSSRAALAAEVEGVRQTLVALANTQYNGRNVFAGTAGATQAVTASASSIVVSGITQTFTAYAWAATGSGTVDRRINANTTVRVDTPGWSVFGTDAAASGTTAATTSVFTMLDNLVKAIQTGSSSGLAAATTDLQSHLNAISTELSSVGARETQLANAADQTSSDKLDLTSALSGVKDADYAETVIKMQLQKTAYQAALAATANIMQKSLMDFLS